MPRSGPTISHAYWGLGSSGSLSSHDYTALIDAAAHGLHTLPQVRLKRFGPQPVRAHLDLRAPLKPLIPTTGST
jgi:hypothetical protein